MYIRQICFQLTFLISICDYYAYMYHFWISFKLNSILKLYIFVCAFFHVILSWNRKVILVVWKCHRVQVLGFYIIQHWNYIMISRRQIISVIIYQDSFIYLFSHSYYFCQLYILSRSLDENLDLKTLCLEKFLYIFIYLGIDSI